MAKKKPGPAPEKAPEPTFEQLLDQVKHSNAAHEARGLMALIEGLHGRVKALESK